MTRLTAAIATLCLTAAPALAQETRGTISGTLEYQDHSWQVVSSGTSGSSRWREEGDGVAVRLSGTPTPETQGDGPALTLSFTATGLGPEAEARDLSTTLTRPGEDATLTAAPVNTDITLTALSVEGDRLVVSGDFVAVLSPGTQDNLLPADAEGAATLDGNFQATLPRGEASDS